MSRKHLTRHVPEVQRNISLQNTRQRKEISKSTIRDRKKRLSWKFPYGFPAFPPFILPLFLLHFSNSLFQLSFPTLFSKFLFPPLFSSKNPNNGNKEATAFHMDFGFAIGCGTDVLQVFFCFFLPFFRCCRQCSPHTKNKNPASEFADGSLSPN